MIEAIINDIPITLFPKKFSKIPNADFAYRVVLSKTIKRGKSTWPWRHMKKGQYVLIPYCLATPSQINNAVRAYSRGNGSVFEYRRTEKGVKIFCVKQK